MALDVNLAERRRINDELSVFTGDLVAILHALKWVRVDREIYPQKLVIGPDSCISLVSIKHMESDAG